MITEIDVLLAQKGDKEAFSRLVKALELPMYRVARSIVRSDEDCADAIQETILKAYKSIAQLKKPHFFKTWFMRILINECNQFLRQRKRTIPVAVLPEEHAESAEYGKVDLWEAVNRLEDTLRLIVKLHYLEDMSVGVISELLEPALSGTGSPVDEHTYAGVIDLMPAEDLPNHFKLQMDISQIGSTKGRWSFSIPVTKMASTNKVVLPMITKSYGDITLTVKKVLFTPGSTELDVEVKQPADAGRFIQYDLFDDKGTQLQRRSGSGRGQTDGPISISTFSQRYGPVSPLPKTITIRPFVDLPFQGPLTESKAPLDQMPTEEKPISLSQGEAGHLLITQVERLPDKTLVHYRTEGLIPQEQANPLWIEDSGGNKYLQLQKPSITVDPVHYRFVKEFPAFTEKEQLTFVTRELTPPGYLKELEITVPLEP